MGAAFDAFMTTPADLFNQAREDFANGDTFTAFSRLRRAAAMSAMDGDLRGQLNALRAMQSVVLTTGDTTKQNAGVQSSIEWDAEYLQQLIDKLQLNLNAQNSAASGMGQMRWKYVRPEGGQC